MQEFSRAYKVLNNAQRQAVDTIDGPVLVVAGPGTGKTQLLGMRAANIVHRTDTLPENILCLTFTESAAGAMRQRLIDLMGSEGNRVAVHTFHSFGSEIINTYPEYFYNGARFTAADELTSYEILSEIFQDLPHSSPLAKTLNGEYTSLRDAKMAISHLKRAGLLPEELLEILDNNQEFCSFANPLFTETFADRYSKKDLPKFAALAKQLAAYQPKPLKKSAYQPLAPLCAHDFARALQQAAEQGKTTPLTAWRNHWCEKNHLGNFVLKDFNRIKKLRALAHVYQKYREALIEQELFDFDDMVSLVAHTMESTPELRFNLQEKYQYIMVDEFQDTNGAQDRLLQALTDNPVNEGRPNILAVGDDDQAIYAFQGAELSNILNFAARYKDTHVITLTDNYRSAKPILEHARQVITQGVDRLETRLEDVRKDLIAHNQAQPSGTEFHLLATTQSELNWVAQDIQKRLKAGEKPEQIAVLARHHRQLVALLPHLHARGIAVNYERRNNVLESAPIIELLTLADVCHQLGQQRYDLAESLLPELLSYDFWGLKTKDLWQLSINAYKQRRMWLEVMIETEGRLHDIAEFLIVVAHQALREPLEHILDILIGSDESQVGNSDEEEPIGTQLTLPGPTEDTFVSPFRAHYFNEHRLGQNPIEYLTLLSNLRAIRQALANYRPNEPIGLRDLMEYVDLCERTGTAVVDNAITQESANGIQLMTAHKAKGLEFNTVFVLSCQDEIWGRKARRPSSSLGFPHNLPIEPAGATYDDALRLFFVAMTRAKQHLILSAHQVDDKGKEAIAAEFLSSNSLQPITTDTADTIKPQQTALGWELRHLNWSKANQQILLQPILENYQLSATHLNNFLDVTRGGPQAFFLQNLLRFPQAMTPSQAFGHAIHAVLARAHTHLSATGEQRPIEDILHDFEIQLQNSRLGEHDFNFLFEKGSDVLHAFLAKRYASFTENQKAERSFSNQNVVINGVRLTGAIDLIDTDKISKTLVITDYKTGKPHGTWRVATDFDKIKLHKYKQQLMLYKLLAENSRDYTGWTVTKGVLEFVEPDANNDCHRLELSYSADELAEFKKLLRAVWQRIMSLDFPDTTKYEPNFKGVLQFESDLIQTKRD